MHTYILFNLEILRLYPAKPYLRRACTRDYVLPKSNGITVNKGTTIYVSVLGIHHDSNHFPNPLKYIPDRFCTEMDPFVYMPFGSGPRQCYGQRYVKMMLMLSLAQLIIDFQFDSFYETIENIDFNQFCFTKLTFDIKLKVTCREDIVETNTDSEPDNEEATTPFYDVPLQENL